MPESLDCEGREDPAPAPYEWVQWAFEVCLHMAFRAAAEAVGLLSCVIRKVMRTGDGEQPQ